MVSGDRGEAVGTPTGRLRKGYVRVAGVTSDEARAELLWIAWDQGITLSQALGVALQEWLQERRRGVSHPEGLHEREEERGATPGRFPPASRLVGGEDLKVEGRADPAGESRRGVAVPDSLSIRGLKDLVLAEFPEGHPLREVILAEKDRLTPAEFLAKMDVWVVLLSRRA